jgi:hypothetical protein
MMIVIKQQGNHETFQNEVRECSSLPRDNCKLNYKEDISKFTLRPSTPRYGSLPLIVPLLGKHALVFTHLQPQSLCNTRMP